mmetsp:Transcript_84010/g.241509  ORF Transcript_84010/g.241509 Transcript_84010/m.241509 type:complete len:304 (+) Transcript_84010:639-1550(+)
MIAGWWCPLQGHLSLLGLHGTRPLHGTRCGDDAVLQTQLRHAVPIGEVEHTPLRELPLVLVVVQWGDSPANECELFISHRRLFAPKVRDEVRVQPVHLKLQVLFEGDVGVLANPLGLRVAVPLAEGHALDANLWLFRQMDLRHQELALYRRLGRVLRQWDVVMFLRVWVQRQEVLQGLEPTSLHVICLRSQIQLLQIHTQNVGPLLLLLMPSRWNKGVFKWWPEVVNVPIRMERTREEVSCMRLRRSHGMHERTHGWWQGRRPLCVQRHRTRRCLRPCLHRHRSSWERTGVRLHQLSGHQIRR